MSRKALWVSKELQKEVRNNEGSNDIERLRNWAKNFEEEEEDSESIEDIIYDFIESDRLEDKIRELSKEEAEDKIYELQNTR